MRWWIRLLVTLVLAPILWRVVTSYLATGQGSSANAVLYGSAAVLGKVYLTYTLPAAIVVGLLLIPAEALLCRIGGDLLIVGVAPILAALVPIGLERVAPGLSGLGQGVVWLAFAYGLTWGLTIREPRVGDGRRWSAGDTGAAAARKP